VEDGESVLEHVRALPYVDKGRIAVYGVSLGGNLAAYLASRNVIQAVVFGAGAVNGFLQDPDAEKNAAAIRCPVLLLVGTEDRLIEASTAFHDLLAKLGKPVQLDIYEGGYHDFVAGPQGHQGRSEPLLTSTLEALDVTLAFLKKALSH
jgi:dienelactone hydrolase